MKILVLLALLTVSDCDGLRVVGHTGQSVTLPCSYDRKHYGALEVCWGRGEIPSSGCNNQLVSIDRYNVTRRASSRFQLLGRLEEGNVSLTILNLTEEDEGRYGCRVLIPGLFNDEKHHIDLIVVEAPGFTTPTTSAVVKTTADQTPVTTTGSDVTGETRPEPQSHRLQALGNTLRLTFIISILVGLLLLTVIYRFRSSKQRSETDRRLNHYEEEEEEDSV